MPKKTTDFKQSLDQLQTLVEQMESGDLSLEASLKAFEQGMKLSTECQKSLAQAELKIQTIMEQMEADAANADASAAQDSPTAK